MFRDFFGLFCGLLSDHPGRSMTESDIALINNRIVVARVISSLNAADRYDTLPVGRSVFSADFHHAFITHPFSSEKN